MNTLHVDMALKSHHIVFAILVKILCSHESYHWLRLTAGDSFHYRAVINNTHVGGMRVGATTHQIEHLCGASVDTREILLTQCRLSIFIIPNVLTFPFPRDCLVYINFLSAPTNYHSWIPRFALKCMSPNIVYIRALICFNCLLNVKQVKSIQA